MSRDPSPPTVRHLTPEEVARRWSISSRTLARLVAGGDLPTVRIGRQLRFREGDVVEYESKHLS
jgi:excisionase family DNA binding protein